MESYADKNTELAVIGNKIDDEANQKVTTAEGEEFARTRGMAFVEASAKTSDRVTEIFEEMGRRVIKKTPERQPAPKAARIERPVEERKEKKSCC